MDRILKIIYTNQLLESNGHRRYLLNGVHPAAINYILDNYHQGKDINSSINSLSAENPSSNWDCFFRHSNFMSYYKKFYTDNNFIGIDQIVDDDAIYLYPIEVGGSLHDFDQTKTIRVGNELYSYTFVDTINPELLKQIKTGKVKILINIIHDPINNTESLYNLENYFEKNGIDPANVIVIGGNTLDQYYEAYPNARLRLTYGYIMVQQSGDRLAEFPYVSALGYLSDAVRESDLDINVVRPRKFLSWNRTGRRHRLWLAYLTQKLNLLDSGYFSFLNRPGGEEDSIKHSISDYDGESNAEKYYLQVYNMYPYDLDTHHLSAQEKTGFTTNNNKKEFYLNSYVHLTTETIFDEVLSLPFFSEKTFHAIVNLQPFIYFGCHGALKFLHNWGIKTFSPFIDESYDDEPDPVKRFRMIEHEIKRINDMPMQELHNWYYSITDVLLHNQQSLKQFSPMNPFENAVNDIRKFY